MPTDTSAGQVRLTLCGSNNNPIAKVAVMNSTCRFMPVFMENNDIRFPTPRSTPKASITMGSVLINLAVGRWKIDINQMLMDMMATMLKV